MPRKTVSCLNASRLEVTCECDVEIRDGSKKTCYQAKLLGMGEQLACWLGAYGNKCQFYAYDCTLFSREQ